MGWSGSPGGIMIWVIAAAIIGVIYVLANIVIVIEEMRRADDSALP